MKRLMTMFAAGALVFAAVGSAAAAPTPTDPLGNHPAFPMVCEGGEFDQPTFGWAVVANGGANGALPTAFFYPGGDATGPDLLVEPVLGVSMYREILDVTEEVVVVDEGARGNRTKDDVLAKWDLSTCTTLPLPGAALAVAYPDAGYQAGHDYVFVNYVK